MSPRHTTSAVVMSLFVLGCGGRGAYDPLPDQKPRKGLYKALEKEPTRQVIAGRGVLVCKATLNDDRRWDSAVIPFMGNEYADLEFRVDLGRRRVRTSDADAHRDIRHVEVPDAEITPGGRLEVTLVDIDDRFHDLIDTHTLNLTGDWPLSSSGEHSQLTCHFTTNEFLTTYATKAANDFATKLAAAEASFDPTLGPHTFGLHAEGGLGELIEALGDVPPDGRIKEAREAEKRWMEKARERVEVASASATPLGTPAALEGVGLEVIGFPAKCGYDAASAARELGVDPEVFTTHTSACLIEVALRNTADTPVELGIPLSPSAATPPILAQRGDSTNPLLFGAHTLAGHSATVFAVALGKGKGTSGPPERPVRSLGEDESLTIYFGARAIERKGFKLASGEDPVVLMRVKDAVWKTVP